MLSRNVLHTATQPPNPEPGGKAGMAGAAFGAAILFLQGLMGKHPDLFSQLESRPLQMDGKEESGNSPGPG